MSFTWLASFRAKQPRPRLSMRTTTGNDNTRLDFSAATHAPTLLALKLLVQTFRRYELFRNAYRAAHTTKQACHLQHIEFENKTIGKQIIAKKIVNKSIIVYVISSQRLETSLP